jgi:hypothetical protein
MDKMIYTGFSVGIDNDEEVGVFGCCASIKKKETAPDGGKTKLYLI